jgi:hypothetical protein
MKRKGFDLNELELNALREKAWQGKLTPEDQDALRNYWAAYPQAQMSWEEELKLAQLLGEIPKPPVASNFTARVMWQVHRDATEHKSKPWFGLSWLAHTRGVRTAALCACGLLLATLAGAYAYAWHSRIQTAQGLSAFSSVASAGLLAFSNNNEMLRLTATNGVSRPVTALDIFRDFEAIRHLSYVPDPSDAQLMTYLQD